MRQLLIVQPYVPTYRVALFSKVDSLLRKHDIELTVHGGSPTGSQAARGDSVVGQPWQTVSRTRSLTIGQHWLRTYGARSAIAAADAVVVELANGAIDSYLALGHRRRRQAVGVWGHIPAISGQLPSAIQRWQLRHADHVFAYTGSGAARATDYGIAPSRISVINNSIDTASVTAAIAKVDDDAISQFRKRWSLPEVPLMCYIGGLDAPKRIDFLASTLDRLWHRNVKLHLVVAGEGADAKYLLEGERRKQVTRIGVVGTVDKATLLKSSMGILCPGRIGLLAVDSLVARLPILSTRHNGHAPEIEYLRDKESMLLSNPTEDSYSAMIQNFLNDASLRRRLQEGCESTEVPTLDAAARNFGEGLLTMMSG